MAIVSSSRSRSITWIFSLKALLLSTAALSTAYAFKISVPAMREFLFSELPQIWTSVLSWLTPPYLYFFMNGFIITIAASFKFRQQKADEPQETAPKKIATARRTSYEVPAGYEAMVLKNPAEIRLEARVCEEKVKEAKEEEDFVISRSDWEPRRGVSTEHSISTEKPPVSVRIGHKKSAKASPEGNGPIAFDISRDISKVAKQVHLTSRSKDVKAQKLESHRNIWQHLMIESVNEDGTILFCD